MKIYKEIKEIAKCASKIHRLVEKLEEKMDTECIEWSSAEFVTLNKWQEKRMQLVDNLYYCEQRQMADDWYCGSLYFKTNVPGQYVRVFFEC